LEVYRSSATTLDSVRASRAIGALFYGAFGGAWVGLWAWRRFSADILAVGLVAVLTCSLIAFVYGRYRRYSSGLEPEEPTAANRRQDRWFHAINAGQWVVILIAGNVLANVGLGEWVIPAAMFIVGLHFVPLARLFENPKHFVTGGALMLLAAAYPFVAAGGPSDPAGALGAGLILWASALWAVL